MSKAVDLLKLFFSLVNVNSTNLERPFSQNSTGKPLVPVTNTPIILKQMDKRLAEVGQASSFAVSKDTFYKINELDLELQTRHNGQIPPSSWIRFNKKLRTVFMFPLRRNEGIHKYLLVARHYKSNLTETKEVEVLVRKRTSQPNHEFVLTTKLNFHKFKTDVMSRYDFARRMARYAVNTDSYGVFLISVSRKLKTVTVSFNTVKDTPCNLKAIRGIKNRLVDSKGRVKQSFKKALSSKFIVTDVSVNLLGPCTFEITPAPGKFDWGIWRHVLPPLILIVIIGGPVGISCIVKKYPGKRRRIAGESSKEKRGWKNEDFEGLFDKAARYDPRKSSLLTVLANENADISNGIPSKVASKHSNGVPNGMVASVSNKRKENKKKEVYIGKSELNIPCYYNFDPNQPPEPEKSVMDSTFESFDEFAGAISSKLKDIKEVAGKSVVNMSSLFGANAEEEATNDDVTKNNPETEAYDDPNNSLRSKAEIRNKQHEGMVTTKTTTTARNPQFSKKVSDNQSRTQINSKNQISGVTSNIGKSEDQLLENTELMQRVMERIASSSQPHHYGQTLQAGVHNKNVTKSSNFGSLHTVENSITSVPSLLYDMNDGLESGNDNTTRALNVDAIGCDSMFQIHGSKVMPNHVCVCSNTNQYESYFDEPYLQHEKMAPGQTHVKPQMFKGFNTAPRRKDAVIEPPNHLRLHLGNKLSRSLNDLSPRFDHGSNLEHCRVLSKSDLCLYQSNSEFISNNDCVHDDKKDELSLYNNDGCYNIENNMDINAAEEPNAFDDLLSIPNNIYSEDHVPNFYHTENLMEHSTLSDDWIPEQDVSDYLNSTDENVQTETVTFDLIEPPLLTVNDYGVDEPFAGTSDRDHLNTFTTKSMLSLPGRTRDSKNQYEFGFTPVSSYEDTCDTYHEYVNVLYSGDGSSGPPPMSSNEIRDTAYWSRGVEYHPVHTDPYPVEFEYYYNQLQDDRFSKSMPDLAQKQHGYNLNPITVNSNPRKTYQGQSKEEEHSLLARVLGSDQTANQPTSSEDTTVVGFIKTKMSSILG